MQLGSFLLLVLLAVVSIDATISTSQEIKTLNQVSHSDDILYKRLLRMDSDSAGQLTTSINTEERMGVTGIKEAVVWLWDAVKVRVKMKYWLYRGKTPEQVLEKLKVTSKTDANYKYYSRYFFNYYVKYPDRQPSYLPVKTAQGIMKAQLANLPVKTAHEIIKARQVNLPKRTVYEIMEVRLRDWLKSNASPRQVFKEMGFTGEFASARGQPGYEYFELYSKMWSALQVRLSQAQ